MFNSTSSSGPDDFFEEDSYSPSSLSSSSSFWAPVMTSVQGNQVCTSCGLDIVDRYLLKVNDLCWHVRCLSCSVCNASLGRHVSCYIKDKQIFCKLDYFRRYGTRCARCGRNINSSDWVRRARGSTFHLACFSCASCKRQLSTGEECGLLENRVFCRTHYEIMMDNINRAKENEQLKSEELSDKESSNTVPRPVKRARTSFTVDQLQIMQSQFAKDNNPDAQTLQKLADQTGLSRRVIQVWFQNCRARQKKHVSPLPTASAMMSLGPCHLTPPLGEDLQYSTYLSSDSPLLTTLTYVDVPNPDPLMLQPLVSHSLT